MHQHTTTRWPLATLCALALAGLAGAANAAQPPAAPAPATLYRQECASCHVAYRPDMLPPVSWQRIMADLPHHFGTDASLDPAALTQLSAWLSGEAAGARRARPAPPQDRITRAAWFIHEHDEIAPATWKRAAIKSASNCAACHTGANQGDFNEHAVRIPR